EEALGYGAFTALVQLPLSDRGKAHEVGAARGFSLTSLEDPKQGPRSYAQLLTKLEKELGSPEAAVLSLFCGYEPARFAQERITAERGEQSFERLAQQLPPGFEDDVARASQAVMLGTAFALAWPVTETAPVTSPFGMRLHPVLGTQRMHTGVDISLK